MIFCWDATRSATSSVVQTVSALSSAEPPASPPPSSPPPPPQPATTSMAVKAIPASTRDLRNSFSFKRRMPSARFGAPLGPSEAMGRGTFHH